VAELSQELFGGAGYIKRFWVMIGIQQNTDEGEPDTRGLPDVTGVFEAGDDLPVKRNRTLELLVGGEAPAHHVLRFNQEMGFIDVVRQAESGLSQSYFA